MAEKTEKTLSQRYIAAKRALFDRKFGFLNAEQRKAVFNINGPLLVLAGAGTGKTTLLVNRIAYILRYGNAYYSENVPVRLSEEGVRELEDAVRDYSEESCDMLLDSFAEGKCPPWAILSITFTNKAANEMKSRITKMVGEETVNDIWCGTFHSMCLRMLRSNCGSIGYERDFTIYDSDDTKKLINECISQLNIDDKAISAKVVMNAIGRAKDELMTPADFDAEVGTDYKQQSISSIYTLYQSKLESSQAVDFDDIIMKCVMMLRQHPEILAHYANKFRYILVDEFQDTNHAQFELVSLLASVNRNLMVVGDDDQSIYKFRGATIDNILRFDEKVNNTKIIKLEENYRSYSNILNAANSVIRHNFGRRGKELWSDRGEGEKVCVRKVMNQNDEARFIVNKIMDLIVRENRSYGDFAVLYRMNAQSGTLENVFARSGIPYRLLGGTRYYERKEVKDILAYLCIINNPGDDLRLTRIINEPKRKIGDATLNIVSELSQTTGKSMFDIMSHASDYPEIARAAVRFISFTDMINELRASLDKMTLTELTEAVIERSGYREMLTRLEENGETPERRENVEELLSVTSEFEKSHENPTLGGFLEEIALFTDIDNYDKSANAVVLMTIHSAKGLEFPVVFIPGAEEGIFPGISSMMSPDELEEERRLAYVAITRAKDRAFIIHSKERMLFGKISYNPRSRFVDEIDENYIVSEGDTEKRRFRTEFGEKTRKISVSNELFASSSLSSDVGRTKAGNTFAAGDRVSHLTFGDGTVLSVREMGSDALYEIAFDGCGTKKLMATYAKLRKI